MMREDEDVEKTPSKIGSRNATEDEEDDGDAVQYTLADIPSFDDNKPKPNINKSMNMSNNTKKKTKRFSPERNGMSGAYSMEIDSSKSFRSSSNSSRTHDNDNGSSNGGTALFTTAAALTIREEVRKFWYDPGRSMKKMKHKISQSAEKFFEKGTVTKDSYHYASVVVSDSNSRKNPFSAYEDDDIDDDDDKFEMGENGYYYGNSDEVNTIGEEIITVRRLFSLAFTLLALSCSSTFSALPPFILIYSILQNIVNRWYICLPFAILRMFDNIATAYTLSRCKNPMVVGSFTSTLPVMFVSVIEIVLYNHMLPLCYKEAHEQLFIQPDGTITIEWESYKHAMRTAVVIGYILVIARICIVGSGVVTGLSTKWPNSFDRTLNLSSNVTKLLLEARESWLCFQFQIYLLYGTLFVSVFVFVVCISSSFTYVLSWNRSSTRKDADVCDLLDRTECMLPFPSSKFLKADDSTATGYRVALSEDILFRVKGSHPVHPIFLNDLDGFSTLGPILFYIDGLKEGGGDGLQGPDFIEHSVTAKSITLLLDIEKYELVHHFAEIDYLDDERPLVIIQPAKPLNHNTAYAVLVYNAKGKKDSESVYLDPSPGFLSLMNDNFSGGSDIAKRSEYFKTKVLPAFHVAASWLKEQDTYQLMFDFHTVSVDSQLGRVRGVRDSVMSTIRDDNWEFEPTVTKVINHDCGEQDLARTFYVDLNVPWYLKEYGDGHRGSKLDSNKVSHVSAASFGKAKFAVHVPCSVMVNAVEAGGGQEVRAVVDYGHGLFYSLEEVENARFFHRMADDNGYIIVAMDWRGMSRYDMPIILNMLLVDPTQVEAIRDNIIQGYANKIALTEFIKSGFFNMEALMFERNQIKFQDHKDPSVVFYGISQGGILGAGYTALLGSSDTIDRSILGVPGAPMAFILSRSGDFGASGHLAGSINDENIPRVLIQAGIGDSKVSYIAAEILARAFGAVRLPNSPREVFGVPEDESADSNSQSSKSVLTELLYIDEATSLPQINTIPPSNNVHFCVRHDLALRSQIAEFINSAKITNPCNIDQCIRQAAKHCGGYF